MTIALTWTTQNVTRIDTTYWLWLWLCLLLWLWLWHVFGQIKADGSTPLPVPWREHEQHRLTAHILGIELTIQSLDPWLEEPALSRCRSFCQGGHGGGWAEARLGENNRVSWTRPLSTLQPESKLIEFIEKRSGSKTIGTAHEWRSRLRSTSLLLQ